MRIGIDIDGVLFPWSDVANEVMSEQFGVPDAGPHVTWDHLRRCVTADQWAWLWKAEGQRCVFGQIDRVYPGAVEMVNGLLRLPDARVHFVTHRDPRLAGRLTAEFLELHFGRHPWAGLHVLQNGTPKHELARWDVFVDDKPETVRSMIRLGVQTFAPQRPWNVELVEWSHHPRFVHYHDPIEVWDGVTDRVW